MLYDEFVKGTGIDTDRVYEDANTIYMNACESMSKEDIYRIVKCLDYSDLSVIAETILKEQKKSFELLQNAEALQKALMKSNEISETLTKLIKDIRLALSKKNIDIFEEYRNSIAKECFDKAYYDAGQELRMVGLIGEEE